VGWANTATPCVEYVFDGGPSGHIGLYCRGHSIILEQGVRGLRVRSECKPDKELEECSVEIRRIDRCVEV
jgi:hypothetical protein